MRRMPLKDRTLPNYTWGEECLNTLSHGLGALFGVVVLVLCIVVAHQNGNTRGIIGGAIYGGSMIILYSVSATYHGLKKGIAKQVLRIIDHCSIYFLIAGTYTPILIGQIFDYNASIAILLLIVEWGGCIGGVICSAIDVHRFRYLSMFFYLAMGWSLIVVIRPVLKIFPRPFFLWVLAGGIAYTVGAVLYGFGKKIRYFHGAFHLFVLAGSALQFVGILLYAL